MRRGTPTLASTEPFLLNKMYRLVIFAASRHSTALRSRVDEVNYRRSITGLVVIDPYNDFISEGGKVWDRLKGVAEANGCVPHMSQLLEATRDAGIPARRLRELEVHRADPEGGVVTQDLRVRIVGRAAPQRG